LVLEPLEVRLRAGLGPVVGPARALERIEAQVGNLGHVQLGFLTEPAGGLIDEPELVVADAHCAQLALPEVPELIAVRRSLAGDHVHLILAVQMHLVVRASELLAPLELVHDVGVAGRGNEGGKPVEPGDDAVLDLAGRYFGDRCVTMCIRVGFSHTKNGFLSATALSMNLSARSRISSSTVSMRFGHSSPASWIFCLPTLPQRGSTVASSALAAHACTMLR